MTSGEITRLLREDIQRGAIDDAFELLLGISDRLRGYLRTRYERFLGGPTGVEIIIVESILQLIHEPPPLPGSESELQDPESLELALFRAGVSKAQERIQNDRQESGEVPEQTRELRDRLEDEIARQPEPLRTVARLDLEHGGRAPLALLSERLAAKRDDILEWRGQVREALMNALPPNR